MRIELPPVTVTLGGTSGYGVRTGAPGASPIGDHSLRRVRRQLSPTKLISET
jgi:hypothetical protein